MQITSRSKSWMTWMYHITALWWNMVPWRYWGLIWINATTKSCSSTKSSEIGKAETVAVVWVVIPWARALQPHLFFHSPWWWPYHRGHTDWALDWWIRRWWCLWEAEVVKCVVQRQVSHSPYLSTSGCYECGRGSARARRTSHKRQFSALVGLTRRGLAPSTHVYPHVFLLIFLCNTHYLLCLLTSTSFLHRLVSSP